MADLFPGEQQPAPAPLPRDPPLPPGYTDPITFQSGGNPYGVTVTSTGKGIPNEVQDAIRHQARRLVEFAGKIA